MSTIQDADRIIVINKGAVAEVGSHEELLARRGFYSGLVARQLKGGASSASLANLNGLANGNGSGMASQASLRAGGGLEAAKQTLIEAEERIAALLAPAPQLERPSAPVGPGSPPAAGTAGLAAADLPEPAMD